MNGERWRRDSNVYSSIFGHARLEYDTVAITCGIVQHCQTLPDVDVHPKIKMEVTETGNGNNYSTDLACDPILMATLICDHAGHVCDTADIVRRWLVTGIQDDGRRFRFP